jgi:hypothetical protein
MKLSTKLSALAAALTTFGLSGMGISLVTTNEYAAGAFALVAAAGAAVEAAARVVAASGNGTP